MNSGVVLFAQLDENVFQERRKLFTVSIICFVRTDQPDTERSCVWKTDCFPRGNAACNAAGCKPHIRVGNVFILGRKILALFVCFSVKIIRQPETDIGKSFVIKRSLECAGKQIDHMGTYGPFSGCVSGNADLTRCPQKHAVDADTSRTSGYDVIAGTSFQSCGIVQDIFSVGQTFYCPLYHQIEDFAAVTQNCFRTVKFLADTV